MDQTRFQNFKEFWPFYLSQHQNTTCRVLHYIGTSLGITLCSYFIHHQLFLAIPLSFIPGYAFAWTGHYLFEKNRPATFQYPFYSFAGDFVMLYYFFHGKIEKESSKAEVQRYLK